MDRVPGNNSPSVYHAPTDAGSYPSGVARCSGPAQPGANHPLPLGADPVPR
jgi:hypothetical protein